MSLVQAMLPLGMLYVMRQIDVEKEDNIFYIRAGYAVAIMTVCLLYLIIYLRIKGNAELKKKSFTVKASELQPHNPVASAMGVPDPTEGQPDQTMTWEEYDMSKLGTMRTETMMQCAIMMFFHYKWGTIQPMMISGAMMVFKLHNNPLVRLHIFGVDPDSDREALSRPFKNKAGFAGIMEQWKEASGALEAEPSRKEKRKLEKERKAAEKAANNSSNSTTGNKARKRKK